MKTLDLGVKDYLEVVRLQEELRRKRIAGEIEDTILFVTHPPVITVGKDPKGKKDFLVPEKQLRKKGIQIVETCRGGRLTYHGPGQLVVYFIFNLKERRVSIHQFVCGIQRACVKLLHSFDLPAEIREKTPGVWSGGAKIAFIGLHVSRGVTMHGLSLNVGGDLSAWNTFVPCGLANLKVTSMEQELQRSVDVVFVKEKLSQLSWISEKVICAASSS